MKTMSSGAGAMFMKKRSSGADAHSQFLCSLARFDLANRCVRQPVHPRLLYARLLVFDKTLAQPRFSAGNCSDELMSVLYSRFNAPPDIFAVTNCCIVALDVFSSDSLTWSANSVYSVQ